MSRIIFIFMMAVLLLVIYRYTDNALLLIICGLSAWLTLRSV